LVVATKKALGKIFPGKKMGPEKFGYPKGKKNNQKYANVQKKGVPFQKMPREEYLSKCHSVF
jgi:hypothetical protein